MFTVVTDSDIKKIRKIISLSYPGVSVWWNGLHFRLACYTTEDRIKSVEQACGGLVVGNIREKVVLFSIKSSVVIINRIVKYYDPYLFMASMPKREFKQAIDKVMSSCGSRYTYSFRYFPIDIESSLCRCLVTLPSGDVGDFIRVLEDLLGSRLVNIRRLGDRLELWAKVTY